MLTCTAGPSGEEVPGVWVDRTGAKVGFHESRSRSSKANFGLVVEEVTTRDEQGAVVTQGTKATPTGAAAPDGPPTTHSKKGKDRVAFLQANVTRDATHYVNGTPIGARDQVTVRMTYALYMHHTYHRAHLCIGCATPVHWVSGITQPCVEHSLPVL